MKKLVLALCVVVLTPIIQTAKAQTAQSVVVSSCGTPPVTYTSGQPFPQTQDTTGKQCTAASVSATVAVAALTSTNLSGTIATTSTFQSIQVATAGRNGCTVQNTSGNGDKMWVFFGAIGGATKAKSFVLTDGQAISCAVGGLGVLTDQVSITGTNPDNFAANFQ